jgi:hypothetical protein
MTGSTAPRTEPAETAPPRAAWVSWFFNAAMWASPVLREPSASMDTALSATHSPTSPHDTMTHRGDDLR